MTKIIAFFSTGAGLALAIALGVVTIYGYGYFNGYSSEREACNQRALQSQKAARTIDEDAAKAAKQRATDAGNEIDRLWKDNKELADEIERLSTRQPPTVIRDGKSCGPSDVLTDDDVKRLRRIKDR